MSPDIPKLADHVWHLDSRTRQHMDPSNVSTPAHAYTALFLAEMASKTDEPQVSNSRHRVELLILIRSCNNDAAAV